MAVLLCGSDRPNARAATGGTAPLGSCTGEKRTDPFFCPSQIGGPSHTGGDNYYVCPPEGCWSYSAKVSDAANYSPQPSARLPAYGGNPDYSQLTPVLEGQLAEGNTLSIEWSTEEQTEGFHITSLPRNRICARLQTRKGVSAIL